MLGRAGKGYVSACTGNKRGRPVGFVERQACEETTPLGTTLVPSAC